MRYVIAFNGPPRSGKDTAANMLADMISARKKVVRVQLSMPMRLAAFALLGIRSYDEILYEESKDMKFDALGGETLRGLMIRLSEEFVKPTYGEHFWMQTSLEAVPVEAEVIIISDLGFQSEADYLCHRFGANRVAVVHTCREGTSFANDSRNYVEAPTVTALKNHGDLGGLFYSVTQLHEFMRDTLEWEV